MKEEKRYEFEVTVKWTQVVFEESEEKATQQLKYIFADEYNLDLTDKEIKLTKN